MLESGLDPLGIIERVLKGFDIQVTETMKPAYKCSCDRNSIKRALASAGREELEDILSKEGEAEMTCYYCNKTYKISGDEIREILGI